MEKLQLTKLEMFIYAAISILVALWCYYRWTIRQYLRISSKIEMCPTYPIIGSSLEFVGPLKRVLKTIMKYEEKYCPKPFGAWLGPIFVVMLSKPEDTQIILNNTNALEKSEFYTFFREVFGESLILAPVDIWKRDRRIIAPEFKSKVIQKWIPKFYDNNKKFIKKFGRKVGKTEPFDLWEYISTHSVDVVCQTTMGYPSKMHSDKLLEFENALKTTLKSNVRRMARPWLYPDVVFYIYKKLMKLDKAYKSVIKLPLQLIFEKKQVFEQKNVSNREVENIKEGVHEKTLLDTLLNFNQTNMNFSENELLHQVLTMISAGSDTTTTTLCFCLLLLAIHQNIQDKVYSEVNEVLGNDDKIISIDEVNKLVYLDQVLKETMRLYPTFPYFLRSLQDDVKISSGDLVLPKGTIVLISANATHHLPELYPNPWIFNPENFSQENIGKRHKYSFIPFSGGPRGCVGTKYAMLFMKMFVSMFLQKFSVHTDIGLKDIELDMAVSLSNSNGYPVTIQSRNRTPMR